MDLRRARHLELVGPSQLDVELALLAACRVRVARGVAQIEGEHELQEHHHRRGGRERQRITTHESHKEAATVTCVPQRGRQSRPAARPWGQRPGGGTACA